VRRGSFSGHHGAVIVGSSSANTAAAARLLEWQRASRWGRFQQRGLQGKKNRVYSLFIIFEKYNYSINE
jgi:hypothetical protein